MSKKAWIIFAAACIVLLGGLIYVSGKDRIDVSNVNLNTIQNGSAQSGDIGDHVTDKKDSKVILLEYGDYQCPGCGAAYPNVKTVTDKYKDQIAVVFRNFPLTSLHPNALAAAAAAEAAGLQGKYWEMHDKLYTNQDEWKDLDSSKRTDFFANYASGLGLNVDKFKTDMASDKVNQKINFDIALGKKAGVDATPSIYLDGTLLDQNTWNSSANLEKAIESELKANNIVLPKS